MHQNNTALLLIDLQNDFCNGGNLAVPEGDSVIAIANQLIPQFNIVIASQDWHPKDHASFASQHAEKKAGDIVLLNGHPQILWPDHCVQETKGAGFHPELNMAGITTIVKKGTVRGVDSYSAFYDNHRLKNTGLTDYLHKKKITDLVVMGLATDYCVKFSCLDAIADGFSVQLVQAGCRGVNLQKHDIEKALQEMQDSGVTLYDSQVEWVAS